MDEYIGREALIRYAEKQEIIIKDGTSVAEAMRIQGNVFRRCVETCPSADVAPKIEVAREIFEEIDQLFDLVCHMIGIKIISFPQYAELKKKYTEEME